MKKYNVKVLVNDEYQAKVLNNLADEKGLLREEFKIQYGYSSSNDRVFNIFVIVENKDTHSESHGEILACFAAAESVFSIQSEMITHNEMIKILNSYPDIVKPEISK